MSVQQTFDHIQEVQTRAFNTFKDSYMLMHPMPEIEVYQEQSKHWIYYALIAGLGGSMVVSAFQTIPAFSMVAQSTGANWFMQIIAGFAGFIAIDLVMLASAFYLTSTSWEANKNTMSLDTIVKYITVAQWFGFVVSVGSNIYFVFFAYNVNVGIVNTDSLTPIMALLIAFAPAVQALVIGHILASMPIIDELARMAVGERNNTRIDAYNRKLTATWKRNEHKYIGAVFDNAVERLSISSNLSNLSDLRAQETVKKPRRSPKLDKTIKFINENMHHLDTSPRELANIIGGVSYETVRTAQNSIRELTESE